MSECFMDLNMDILPQRPGFESQLAEVGDIANALKRLSFLSLTSFMRQNVTE